MVTLLFAARVAVDVDRDSARRAAQQELSKRIYHRDDPSLVQRAFEKFLHWVQHLADRAGEAAPGGKGGLVLLAVVLAVAVIVIAHRLGPLARAARATAPLFEGGPRDAESHRRAADRHAAAGEFAEAVRERLRAIVRELEQRGVLEPRAGRTADEAAAEAGVVLPMLASDLREAAQLFDDIWYGGRPATAGADAALRALDQRVRTERVGAL